MISKEARISQIISLVQIAIFAFMAVSTLIIKSKYPRAGNPFAPGYNLLEFGVYWPALLNLVLTIPNLLLLAWEGLIAFRTKTWNKRLYLLGLLVLLLWAAVFIIGSHVGFGCGCAA